MSEIHETWTKTAHGPPSSDEVRRALGIRDKPHAPVLALGARVRIVDADIEGLVTEHTRYLDGSERWMVQFWCDGKRTEINCMERELEVVEAE